MLPTIISTEFKIECQVKYMYKLPVKSHKPNTENPYNYKL